MTLALLLIYAFGLTVGGLAHTAFLSHSGWATTWEREFDAAIKWIMWPVLVIVWLALVLGMVMINTFAPVKKQ